MVSRELEERLNEIAEFCRRWRIRELAVFGSATRADFGPHSDIDLLATFAPDASWSLLDHQEMREELMGLLGRDVDLLTRRSVERSDNWIRRRAILDSAEVLYAA